MRSIRPAMRTPAPRQSSSSGSAVEGGPAPRSGWPKETSKNSGSGGDHPSGCPAIFPQGVVAAGAGRDSPASHRAARGGPLRARRRRARGSRLPDFRVGANGLSPLAEHCVQGGVRQFLVLLRRQRGGRGRAAAPLVDPAVKLGHQVVRPPPALEEIHLQPHLLDRVHAQHLGEEIAEGAGGVLFEFRGADRFAAARNRPPTAAAPPHR